MKIGVSDYDGTLKRGGTVAEGDLAAIRRWREAGHLFGIATGRDLGMTTHEIDLWGIPFDFLICLNGAAIYDSSLGLLQAIEIGDDLTPALLSHPAANASMHLGLMIDTPLRLCYHGDASWFHTMDLPKEEIDFSTALTSTGLRQVSFGYGGDAEALDWTDRLNKDFADRICAHHNANSIDITRYGVDKAQGIGDLVRLLSLGNPELFVIGDGGNDVQMLSRYDGYTVPQASSHVKEMAGGRVVDGVGRFLDANR